MKASCNPASQTSKPSTAPQSSVSAQENLATKSIARHNASPSVTPAATHYLITSLNARATYAANASSRFTARRSINLSRPSSKPMTAKLIATVT